MANVPYQPDEEPIPWKAFIGIFLCLLAVALIVTACREEVVVQPDPECEAGTGLVIVEFLDACTMIPVDPDLIVLNGMQLTRSVTGETGFYGLDCFELGVTHEVSVSLYGYVTIKEEDFIVNNRFLPVPLYPEAGCLNGPADLTPELELAACISAADRAAPHLTDAEIYQDCCDNLMTFYPEELAEECL